MRTLHRCFILKLDLILYAFFVSDFSPDTNCFVTLNAPLIKNRLDVFSMDQTGESLLGHAKVSRMEAMSSGGCSL